jgi:hypothetical protein
LLCVADTAHAASEARDTATGTIERIVLPLFA